MNANDIKVAGACQCGICGATAHLMVWGAYECADNPMHCADQTTGIFIDLTNPDMEKMAAAKSKVMEGVMFKPHNPYHPDDGGKFVKFTSDLHVGKTFETMHKIDGKALMEKLKAMPFIGQNPCLELPVAGGKALKYPVEQTVVLKVNKPVEKITVTMKVEPPKAYPMPLLNPKSEWGKRMKEKLQGKS